MQGEHELKSLESSNETGTAPRIDWNPVEHYKDVEVAERYDRERFASVSGRVFDALEKWNIRRAFSGLPDDSLIVDVPCGTGRHAEVLLEQGHRVVGVDVSPAMLEVARRKLSRFGERFRTFVWDARRLAELGERYDAALCARVLMHFPLSGQVEFLAGVAKATQGRVVFTQSYSTWYQQLRRSVKRVFGHVAPAAYPLTQAELEQLLAGAGLQEIRRHRVLPLISEAITVVSVAR
ncbi:class I SAM-dependent methyltransferase [Nitrococcus mobilis]|uniref:Methyltransferase domain-containing protein n=1 Tax=Nitrococcus mobilis Nb-231 TaxID=314278 RepID=A4BT68_9GAMM|nr:class I SAM-dependent methyltransferase [Nitrococcus mobilis]EAR21136.1 hypothetical protein NB231_08197 [Nitrococcus mobilis Nb-231]